MPDTIILKIENCNNIDSGNIEIKEGCLNIKYGINGTGKTTIGKSIMYSINDRINSTNQLKNLHSFKFLNDTTKNPSLIGIDNYQNPVIFNEEYVNQYAFVVDEVIQNSFQIFIEDDAYKAGLEAINNLIKDIGTFFTEDQTIDNFIRDLNQFISYSGNATSGLHKSGTAYKALSQANLIANIPDGLEDYCDHIRSSKSISRIGWQQQGQRDFFNISNKCPFCTQDTDSQKEKIELLNQKYDPKVIEHLQKIIQVLTSLENYLNEDTNIEINRIANKSTDLNDDDEKYLFRIKQECEDLRDKLSKIKYINFNSLKNEDLEKISDILEAHKIPCSQFVFLSSSVSIVKFQEINDKIDVLLIRAAELKSRINSQNSIIGQRIKESKENVNAFLLYAGYQYHIDCIEENGKYKIIMKHNEGKNLVKGKDHLSFGERNAFALILFMFDAIKKNADLIILDDPISSFDKNKKYAILDMLFKTGVGIRGKTILMLTHDFEPIIDIIYNKKPQLDGVSAHFLHNKNGNLSEKIIKKNDISSFMDIAIKNINELNEDVNKMIYLRRLYEINNNKNSAYQVLSNLFKKRTSLENKDGNPLDQNIIDQGCSDISKDIPGFDYGKYCDQFNDIKYMVSIYENSTNNFEKLQIYRIINNDNHTNNVVRKFINEAYHIENDYLFQLNPCEYEIVPEYIIEECNKDIEEIKTSF